VSAITVKVCSEANCNGTPISRELCRPCYGRWYRLNRNNLMGEAQCEECGDTVTLRAAGRLRKYCSTECKHRANYRRSLEAATCPRCNSVKESNRKLCEACSQEKNRWDRFKKHGLSKDTALALIQKQRGCCAVCRCQLSWGFVHVDHDHRCCSGEFSCGRCVRGFLCPGCNVGLGNFNDAPTKLEAAATYIRSWKLQEEQLSV
jgi:recombination endonuclease VII